jgi:hypothetical protein
MKSNKKNATNFVAKKELMHNGLKKKERKKTEYLRTRTI